VTTDISIHALDLQEYDGVIIPGGYAPDRLRRHPEVIAFVHNLFLEGKVVASICHGAWALISADIVRDRNVTCHYTVKDDVVNAAVVTMTQKSSKTAGSSPRGGHPI